MGEEHLSYVRNPDQYQPAGNQFDIKDNIFMLWEFASLKAPRTQSIKYGWCHEKNVLLNLIKNLNPYPPTTLFYSRTIYQKSEGITIANVFKCSSLSFSVCVFFVWKVYVCKYVVACFFHTNKKYVFLNNGEKKICFFEIFKVILFFRIYKH